MISKNTTIIICYLFLNSCSFTKPVAKQKTPATKPAEFSYSPPGDGTRDTNKLKLIILNPRYDYAFGYKHNSLFETFLKSMKEDFLEMVIGRGFQYRGPYETRDEIVFSDKKFADMVLEPIIEFNLEGLAVMRKSTYNFISSSYTYSYYVDGNATLTGKINLEITEPYTNTKLWKKSITIPSRIFAVKTYYKYNDIDNVTIDDPGIWNPLVENLQEIYSKSLQTAWNHLDPEELKLIRDQSLEIRNNSGFNKK